MKQNKEVTEYKEELRQMIENIADKYKADLIIIQGVSTKGLGLAITNRLLRACNYNVY